MKLNAIPWCFRKLYQGYKRPKYLVRLCRSLGDFEPIVSEAKNSADSNWSQDLIQQVIEQALGGEASGISTYEADTIDAFDSGHALAVVAEGINQGKLRVSKGSKRDSKTTRGSLIIPVSSLPKTTHYEFTPENNLNFYPANHRHFDLDIKDSEELAITILNGIRDLSIKPTFIANDKKYNVNYRLMWAIAYSHCLKVFGTLNHSKPPTNWADGQDLTASEQIETLQYVAQVG
ncbi:hypothetical protein [Nostoc sp. JL23]|uniref:hypothetical protein n=1 Tax=Nostoc sp. JL23 TaxID=2815394 RepID=UPI001D84C9D5|nr:hypothetical protein [Nostoc sp. JL23]MBN3875231.1 hypothetical protein [Nostoc sp. JL23]